MGIMRRTLTRRLRRELRVPVADTKGYITKYTRVELLHLPKSHAGDALAIAQGRHGFDIRQAIFIKPADRTYQIKPVRHHKLAVKYLKLLERSSQYLAA